MTREQAKQYILDNSESILESELGRDKKGKGFICPICNSGTGKNGTGITHKPGETHYSCFARCFTNADIFDIIGMKYGLEGFNEQFKKCCELANIDIESNNYSITGIKKDNRTPIPKPTKRAETPHVERVDYTDYYEKCHKAIGDTIYHRGLSDSTIDKYMIGYDKAINRLIIPTSKYSYLGRYANDSVPSNINKCEKSKGETSLLNVEALETSTKPIYIVEGELDALSIIDVGGVAVALGGVAMINKLIRAIEKNRPQRPIIIALDNDTPGKEASDKLKARLEGLQVPYIVYNVAGDYKDANELLEFDRLDHKNDLSERVREGERQALSVEHRQQDNQLTPTAETPQEGSELEQLESGATVNYIEAFKKCIEENAKRDYVSTGYSRLDEVLEGGLYPGLYVIGAISSLGKTTFTLQLADNIARAGIDVLIFSLEMSKYELMAKSISRLTYLKAKDKRDAKTTRGILTGSRYQNYSFMERQLIDEAIGEYSTYAKHLYIYEGIGNIKASTIRDAVEKHTNVTGKPPIVIIDYLQIIAPYNERMTDKQNTDKAVIELKRISRDFNTSIIGISSFNRDNYTAPVNLASFKESGAIEYSSDVLIGLQYDGMDYQEGEKEKDRDTRVREVINKALSDSKEGKAQTIQLKVLKNRNGNKGTCSLYFYPMFNNFTEQAPMQEVTDLDDIDKKIMSDFLG